MSVRIFLALLAAALNLSGVQHASAQEPTVTVSSWGGSFQDAQRDAIFKPFEKETGIHVVETTGPSFAKIKTMVSAGNAEFDVGEVTPSDYLSAVRENLLEKLDYSKIHPSILSEIDKQFILDYGLGVMLYTKVLAYNTTKFPPGKHPKTWAEMWDVKTYPGPRVVEAGDYVVPPIEYALLADGVPKDKLYPLDLDRAYKSLAKLRPNVVRWSTTAAMQPQAIVDGEAYVGAVTLGRVVALKESGAPIDFEWDGGLAQVDYWAIPKGAKNYNNALKFIEFASRPEIQAALAKLQVLGPVNKKAFDFIPPDRAKQLPTYSENLAKEVFIQPGWWSEVGPDGKTNQQRNNAMWSRWVMQQ
jgi:putative spermidine/putrescine transport system substrate-binding protein